jgi:hypothetical protein
VLVVVLIVVAAIVAPVATADKWGTARTSDSRASLRPDDRSGARNTLIFDPVVIPVANEASVPVAFQWGDAGMGGAIAVAAMILAGGIVLVVRRSSVRPSVT